MHLKTTKSQEAFLQESLEYLQKAQKLLEGVMFISGNKNLQKQIDEIKQVIKELQEKLNNKGEF